MGGAAAVGVGADGRTLAGGACLASGRTVVGACTGFDAGWVTFALPFGVFCSAASWSRKRTARAVLR